jgi:putative ABC transport system permease protein
MNQSIATIPFSNLAAAFVPVIIVVFIMQRWSGSYTSSLIPIIRMLMQLLLIGYLLTFIFAAEDSTIVLSVLAIMMAAASWIGLRTLKAPRWPLLKYSFMAIMIGGGSNLLLIVIFVLELDPWYSPRYIVPLAGMIFFNAMNSISIAAERLEAELVQGTDPRESRHIAYRTSMIPAINGLLAVGLVSLPGMMTGQILSGVSPLIAVRYQIMVMCMTFGCAGITSACFLLFAQKKILNHSMSVEK